VKSHENNPNRVNKVHGISFWHTFKRDFLERARFPREELGEKCEKHICRRLVKTERRARFSGQLRERFTACTEIEEEYRSIKCWHKNRGGVLLHRNRGEVRPAFNAVRLHLFAHKSRKVQLHLLLYGCINFLHKNRGRYSCINCCTDALNFCTVWHKNQGAVRLPSMLYGLVQKSGQSCCWFWHSFREENSTETKADFWVEDKLIFDCKN